MDEQHFSHEYRTGRTEPRQNNSGIITFLLISVIFLAGLVSAMGLLNIRLFHQMNHTQANRPPISFTQGNAPNATDYTTAVTVEAMTLSEFSSLYRQVFELPQGLYVCHVQSGSPAEQAGILPGDVLTHIDGTPICRLSQAKDLLSQGPVELELFRDGMLFTVCLD